MFLQETYEVIDGIFYDKGTETPPANTWINNNFTLSFDNTGTLLSSTAFSTYFANKKDTTIGAYDWDTPFIVEFDLINFTTGDFQIYDQTNNCTRTFTELDCTSNNHIKIVNDGTNVKYYVEGVEKTSKQFTYTIGTCRVGFRNTSSSQESIKFKNFVIYPI